MKIIIAGNPEYGLSKSVCKLHSDATFISRSHGNMDLTIPSRQREFAKLSLEYNIFISISCLWRFAQTELVQEVAKNWIERKHGYIIAIGSSADTPIKGSAWMYPVEKKALRAYCRQLSQVSAGDNDCKLKVTYLSPGNLHTPKQDEKLPGYPKLDCDYVASIIKWLIDQPTDVNISELCFDKLI
tara:strand:- start:113 stop:667 length:555 start_codon:yes stop_codon:yes gene_type:complete